MKEQAQGLWRQWHLPARDVEAHVRAKSVAPAVFTRQLRSLSGPAQEEEGPVQRMRPH